MFKAVRVRLTWWYVGVLAIVLVLFSIAVYGVMARSLRDRVDASLESVLDVTSLSLRHEIGEHEGKDKGEQSFRQVLQTMHQQTFPEYGIAVFEGERLVASKYGDHGAGVERHASTTAGFHTNGDLRDAVRMLRVPEVNTTYQIVAAGRLSAANVELAWLRHALLGAVPLALLLMAAGGWFLAQRSLQPAVLMARRLEEAFEQQRQFMADASHELRTPISIARTAAEVTLESRKQTEDDYRESLTVIEQQLRRLTRIVQDMFTLAQADAGVYTLQASPFYLDEVLRECVKAAGVLGSRRSVSVSMEPAEEAPCHGDEGLIRQLVMILLDNGIKYTPEGGSVRLALEAGSREYRIRVSDTGIGIPPESQPLVFRRFYRVDKARSRASSAEGGSGAGLGLAIAQWIAQVHRGRLELTSSRPGGTVFTAAIPAGAGTDA